MAKRMVGLGGCVGVLRERQADQRLRVGISSRTTFSLIRNCNYLLPF